jgi:hypothetical protein
MRNNNRSSAISDNIGKNLPRMNRTLIEKANGNHTLINNFVCSVQGNTNEIFLLLSCNICDEWKNILSNGDLDGVPRQVASCEFKRR